MKENNEQIERIDFLPKDKVWISFKFKLRFCFFVLHIKLQIPFKNYFL